MYAIYVKAAWMDKPIKTAVNCTAEEYQAKLADLIARTGLSDVTFSMKAA